MTIDPLYPIVDHPEWVERLGRSGARLIQLRMKDLPEPELRVAIRASLSFARTYALSLVVNDHWRLALDEGAEWIHLGQEDLDTADLAAIRRGGLKLGLSTHDEEELARAWRSSRIMSRSARSSDHAESSALRAQGMERITHWQAAIAAATPPGHTPVPLVAIGGITLETARACLDHGADSVAIVTDILKAPNPEARCRALLAVTRPRGAAARAGTPR